MIIVESLNGFQKRFVVVRPSKIRLRLKYYNKYDLLQKLPMLMFCFYFNVAFYNLQIFKDRHAIL
jgi:hypothetical protein